MTAYIPVLAAILGALVYVLAANAKAKELGRILYAAGCFAMLFAFGGHMVKLFG